MKQRFAKLKYFVIALLLAGVFWPAGSSLKASPMLPDEPMSELPADFILEDEAELFTADERAKLEELGKELNEDYPFVPIAVFTAADTGGKEVRAYGEDRFEALHPDMRQNDSGVFAVIIPSEEEGKGQFYFGTYGYAIDVFSDARINEILEALKPEMKQHKYFAAMRTLLSEVDYYLDLGPAEGAHRIKENRFFTLTRLFVFLAVLILVTLGTFLGYRKTVKLDYDKFTARPLYDVSGQAVENYSLNNDQLIDKRTVHVYKPLPKESSSSGGSTTHTTSGGKTSGGGGFGF